MGGHMIYPGGIVIDMLPFNRIALDGTRTSSCMCRPARAGAK